ncbi:YtpI family protein [Cohnella yongneupensis]|uniref:YtpI family protein n=1 Tax=Cohnella yongneupensis TaxID=425006 RepID=A0ABW0R1W5_9BACL
MLTLKWVLAILVIATSCLSVLNSFKSRQSKDGKQRGLHASRMNIYMGLMLIFLSILMMLLFTGSSLLVVVCLLFMLLGIFNLFAGMRNRSYYSRLQQEQSR